MAARFAILLALSPWLWGQGTQPKPKPADYPSSGKAGRIEIGAENWGHGFSSKDGAFALDDYIAVEVGLYSEGNKTFQIRSGEFTLTLNGSKSVLIPQSAGMVAASLKYPDWEDRPQMVGEAGSGDGSVIFGRRRPVGRFPGDQRTQDRVNLPRAPGPDQQGVPQKQAPTVDEVVTAAAMPEGEIHPPVSGFLFFPYKRKLKSLKSIVLRYEGAEGSATLQLR